MALRFFDARVLRRLVPLWANVAARNLGVCILGLVMVSSVRLRCLNIITIGYVLRMSNEKS